MREKAINLYYNHRLVWRPQSVSGMGYATQAEKMEPLYLTNSWTNSRAGCRCDVDGSMVCVNRIFLKRDHPNVIVGKCVSIGLSL